MFRYTKWTKRLTEWSVRFKGLDNGFNSFDDSKSSLKVESGQYWETNRTSLNPNDSLALL